eukprot:11051092-Heterocapsa_arctica.AAC.1
MKEAPDNKTKKYTTWLLIDTFLLTSGFNLDELALSDGCIHRMINFGLNIDCDDGCFDDDDKLPPLEEVEGVEKNKPEKSKAKFELLTKLMKE